MKKIIVVIALVLAVLALVHPAEAQAAENLPSIGLLGPPEEPRFSEIKNGLIQGL